MIYIRTVYRHDVKSFEDNTSARRFFIGRNELNLLTWNKEYSLTVFRQFRFNLAAQCTAARECRVPRFFPPPFFRLFSPPLSFFFFPSSIFFPPQKFPLFPIYSIRFSRYKLRKGLRRCSKASSSSNNGIVTKVMQFGNYDTRYFFSSPSFSLFSESVGRK